jgi:RNA polymerase sigma-70 factor (ECF subfamily)
MSTWLAAIVINCARMQLRRRPHQPHVSLDEPSGDGQEYYWFERLAWSGPSPEDECRKSELHGRLMECVEQLSPSLRRAFQLSDFDGLALKEVAHTLGVAEGTVKAQVSRARAKLSRLMIRSLRGKSRSILTRTGLPGRGRSKQSKQDAVSRGRCVTSV